MFDIHEKSAELLEKLANSVFDRDPTTNTPLYFTQKEIQIVEAWMADFIHEEDFI